MAKQRKCPRGYRLLRYVYNCMWYHVLFPVGMPEDGFSKNTRPRLRSLLLALACHG